MKRTALFMLFAMLACLPWHGEVAGRGFGGFRGGYGGDRFGGYRGGGGFDRGGYGGDRIGGSYSGSRSFGGYSGWDRGGGSSSYDRSWTGERGGSINTEGSRGYAYGPRGAAAGGSRETTATGPEGRSYSSESQRGAAVGPYGRAIGGSEGTRTATGPRGTATAGWQSAYSGRGLSTDFGLGHYSTFGTTAVGHSTAYWSHGYVNDHAGYVRNNFGYYNCFHPNWYAAHPGCWNPAGWAAGLAWRPCTWPAVIGWCGVVNQPINYDFGDTVVINNNTVYDNGQSIGSAQDFAQQATTLATQGQKPAPPQQEWKPLGVFALVQGQEKTSNNIFQLALDKDGVIRGNYYDGLMDTTTEVFGSVDKKSQRAAWTVGKNKDRVFDAGIYNLTQSETPVLVHFGADRSEQMLLVRVEKPSGQ